MSKLWRMDFKRWKTTRNCSIRISEFYVFKLARGVRWNDPAFGISWPIPDPILVLGLFVINSLLKREDARCTAEGQICDLCISSM